MSSIAGQHWQRVYAEKDPTQVSWYQAVPTWSLAIINAAREQAGVAQEPGARAFRVIDVGGGASTLVDSMIDWVGVEMCVVDIAGSALAAARGRLGARSSRARWVECDVTGAMPEIEDGWADLWHDRAVFHFFTEEAARRAYARNLARILRPRGVAVIAAFAPDGPCKCSGLDVARHDGESIRRELSAAGVAFTLEKEDREQHTTPWGAVQRFTYAVLRRVG